MHPHLVNPAFPLLAVLAHQGAHLVLLASVDARHAGNRDKVTPLGNDHGERVPSRTRGVLHRQVDVSSWVLLLSNLEAFAGKPTTQERADLGSVHALG